MHKASLSLYCAFSNAMLLHSVFMSRASHPPLSAQYRNVFPRQKAGEKARTYPQLFPHTPSLPLRWHFALSINQIQFLPRFRFFVISPGNGERVLAWKPPLCRIKRCNSQRSSVFLCAFPVGLYFYSNFIYFSIYNISVLAHCADGLLLWPEQADLSLHERNKFHLVKINKINKPMF